MKKTILKIFLIVVLVLFTITMTNVYGVEVDPIIGMGDTTTTGNAKVDASVTKIMNNALGVISVVGVAIAFGMLIFVGIKLFSAAPSEKADVKKYIVIYVVGAVCILGAIFILNILGDFGEELTNVMK